MVLVVVPQAMAQVSAADAAEMQRLTLEFQAGRITFAEYQRRIAELSTGAGQNTADPDQQAADIERRVQQAEQRQQPRQQAQQQQGDTRGWPSNSIWSACNLPNLRQPSRTTVSYTYNNERNVLKGKFYMFTLLMVLKLTLLN